MTRPRPDLTPPEYAQLLEAWQDRDPEPSWFQGCAALAFLAVVVGPGALLVWAVLR